MFSNLNMKKIVLWLVIIMSVAFIIAAALFVVYEAQDFFGTLSNSGSYSENLNQEKTFNIQEISDIDVNVVGTNVNFILVEGQDLKAHLYGRVSSKTKNTAPQLNVELQGSKLLIEEKRKFHFINIGSYNSDLKLDIYIPKNYPENISVNAVSGDLRIEGLNLNKFSYKSVSGNLDSKSLITKETSLDTVSGDFEIDAFEGNLNYNSVSGDLSAMYKTFDNNIRINTISGDTKIKLPANAEFYLRTGSVSGDTTCDFPITLSNSGKKHGMEGTVGSNKNEIKADSVSGDVNIYK